MGVGGQLVLPATRTCSGDRAELDWGLDLGDWGSCFTSFREGTRIRPPRANDGGEELFVGVTSLEVNGVITIVVLGRCWISIFLGVKVLDPVAVPGRDLTFSEFSRSELLPCVFSGDLRSVTTDLKLRKERKDTFEL